MNGMPNFLIEDFGIDDVCRCEYDLAIFASGYESRCTQSVQVLPPGIFKKCFIIGFKKAVLPELREKHDQVFAQRTGQQPTLESQELPVVLAKHLTEAVSNAAIEGRSARVLVDYSSMRREWYGFVLAFLGQLAASGKGVTIDFLYSFGVYPPGYEESIENAVLESIVPLAGMEGLSASRASSIAIFGLGFSPVAGLGALERLQPDKVLSFFASPGSSDEYMAIAKRCNESLIKRSSGEPLELSMESLSAAYRGLCELAWPFVDRFHVNILPMGPKPHVLASMLVANTYKPVGCLYGKVQHPSGVDIVGNRRYCIGAVHMNRPDPLQCGSGTGPALHSPSRSARMKDRDGSAK